MLRILLLMLAAVVGAGPAAGADEEADTPDAADQAAVSATRTVKTVDGHHFVVASDRPIEKTGGVYKPVDIDAYVAVKTRRLEEAMDERLGSLETRLEALTQRVQVLEDLLKERAAGTPETGKPAPAAAVSLPE